MSKLDEQLMDQVLKDENKLEMFMKELTRKDPHEPEFLQAAHDVSQLPESANEPTRKALNDLLVRVRLQSRGQGWQC